MKRSNTSGKYLKTLNNYKNPELGHKLLAKIRSYKKCVTLMEVCGTHTMAFFRTGIRRSLPENITLLSGPGCPVCVTPIEVIEKAMRLACRENTVFFCFGDMMKVPGMHESLETAKAQKGAKVKVMYSPMEALEYAQREPQKTVVLLGVGFETTIPLFASVVMRAHEKQLKNLYLFPAFKLIPPALRYLLSSDSIAIDGFILPGHVSAILGEKSYQFMADEYRACGVVTGFQLIDLLEGVLLLLDMISHHSPGIKNQYSRFVSKEGNTKARELIDTVFAPDDAYWRGIGILKESGLRLKEDYARYDASQLIDFDIGDVAEPPGCCCGAIITGKMKPFDCALFKSVCTPRHPIGPCMVSSEGTCAAYYKYSDSALCRKKSKE